MDDKMTKTGVYWLFWSSVFWLVDDMKRHNFFLNFLAGEAIFTISNLILRQFSIYWHVLI